MDLIVASFRFAFRAVAHNPVSVHVNACLKFGNETLRRPPHELSKHPGGSFLGKTSYQVRIPSVMVFQFTCTHSGQGVFRGEGLRYELTSAPTDPVLISDYERVEQTRTVTLRFKLNYETYFCPFESHSPVDLLGHLHGTHRFVLADVQHTPLLPRYLDYWRFHAPLLVPVQNSDPQMIDPDDPEDAKLKLLLHNMRLDAVMCEHEAERTVRHSSLPCLFCSELFDGTWHDYLQQLFETRCIT